MAGGHRHGQGVREIFFRVVVVLHVRERERERGGAWVYSILAWGTLTYQHLSSNGQQSFDVTKCFIWAFARLGWREEGESEER